MAPVFIQASSHEIKDWATCCPPGGCHSVFSHILTLSSHVKPRGTRLPFEPDIQMRSCYSRNGSEYCGKKACSCDTLPVLWKRANEGVALRPSIFIFEAQRLPLRWIPVIAGSHFSTRHVMILRPLFERLNWCWYCNHYPQFMGLLGVFSESEICIWVKKNEHSWNWKNMEYYSNNKLHWMSGLSFRFGFCLRRLQLH